MTIFKKKGSFSRWGPEIPDHQYFPEHPTYTGFLLWIRGIRPYIEKAFYDMNCILKKMIEPSLERMIRFVRTHNPDVRYQAIALISFYLTSQSICMHFNRDYQKLMDLKYLRGMEEAQVLEKKGFWKSEKEDLNDRIRLYNQERQRLNSIWNRALSAANENNNSPEHSFQILCEHLMNTNDPTPVKLPLILPNSWRFDMIPYATEDSLTFPIPNNEKPHRAFAFNLTTNNLFYDWGDYINRKDNKLPALRRLRPMFTNVYIPPSK